MATAIETKKRIKDNITQNLIDLTDMLSRKVLKRLLLGCGNNP